MPRVTKRRSTPLRCLLGALCFSGLTGCQDPDWVWITKAELTTELLLDFRRTMMPIRAEINGLPETIAGLTKTDQRERGDKRNGVLAIYGNNVLIASLWLRPVSPENQYTSITDPRFRKEFSGQLLRVERGHRDYLEDWGIVDWAGPQEFVGTYTVMPAAGSGEQFVVARFLGPDFASYLAAGAYNGYRVSVSIKVPRSQDAETRPDIEAFVKELGSHLPVTSPKSVEGTDT